MLTCLRGHQCHGSRKKANFQTSHSRYTCTWSGKFDRPSKQIRNRARRRRRRRQHQSYNQSAGSKCSTWSGKPFKLSTPGTQGMSSTRIAQSVTVKADKKSCDDDKSSASARIAGSATVDDVRIADTTTRASQDWPPSTTRASHDRSPSKQIRSRATTTSRRRAHRRISHRRRRAHRTYVDARIAGSATVDDARIVRLVTVKADKKSCSRRQQKPGVGRAAKAV